MTLSAADLDEQFSRFLPRIPVPARNPGHRQVFKWPPHPVSLDYHVLPSSWSEKRVISINGEEHEVKLARAQGVVFARVDDLRAEAMATSEDEIEPALKSVVAPLFQRTKAISKTLGLKDRFKGNVRDLEPIDLLKLLYCSDRDVAHEASVAIETHASLGVFTKSLIKILQDQAHPDRRIAQWCVLDMFEDLPSLARSPQEQSEAIQAIKALIWNSEDDYARTIYKAGVVLGGHICTEEAAEALIDCLDAPHKIGRRSAIHGVFHLVEWLPSKQSEVVSKLKQVAVNDPEPLLQHFASHMAADIESGSHDHIDEPRFPDEKRS